MIELHPGPAGRRPALSCDSCGLPVTRAADACLVAWASRTALVCHRGRCLDALRLQYPSTTSEPVIPLDEALGQLADQLLEQRPPEAAR